MKDYKSDLEKAKADNAQSAEDSLENVLNQAIDQLKSDLPVAEEVAGAEERVRKAIMLQRGPQNIVPNAGQNSSDASSWNSLEDYIAAIPQYLAKELSPAQTLLFEEESRSSIPLRRALEQARNQETSNDDANKLRRSGSFAYRWMATAATVAAVAVVALLALPELPSFNQAQLAQIDRVEGQLYQIVNGRLENLTPGSWIDGQQRIRSAGNSGALITLDDGSQIEIDERSELSLTRRSSGNRIDVSRGQILVVASPQGSGTLDVFTDEFTVSVTGTIFEVAHGAKGSRVSVVEGSVDVLMQGDTKSLEPGQVLDSRSEYLALTAAEEIAWSQNADLYIAMLQEVAALQQDIQAVIDSPPRYSTRLLDLVPEYTAVYMAVPNAPAKITDVYDVIRNRMQSSTTLSEAWAEFESTSEVGHLDEIMSWLQEIGYSLGEETVLALTTHEVVTSEGEGMGAPVILSEVDAEAFRASFNDQLAQIRATLEAEGLDSEMEIAIVDDPADAVAGELSILLWEDILVASITPEMLTEMQENLDNNGSAFVGSELHELLQYSYTQGTEILGAVDFPTLFAPLETDAEVEEGLDAIGLSNAEYLIAQHRLDGSASSITADFFFNGAREGLLGWLDNPGPMGSLEFFSTDTTFVAAALLKEPNAILEELGPIDLPDDFDAQAELDLFYSVMSVLGGEVAFGLDGPTLPTPSWKVVIEAYDEAFLQESIEWSIEQMNEYAAASEEVTGSVEIVAANVGGYSGYQVSLSIEPGAMTDFDMAPIDFNYVYVDGYLVAGPDEALLDRALGFYESGSGLQTDPEFQELLSRDGYLDFSLLSFSRLGELVSDVLGSLPSTLTQEQQAAVSSIDMDVGPSISSVLALTDSMHLAHNGSSQLPIQVLSQLAALQPLIEGAADQNSTQ